MKTILFDIDHTLYNYDVSHDYALKKVFQKIHKITWTKISLLEIIYDISKKEIYRQLTGTAASHNKELQFQKMFEHLHQTIQPKIILDLYNIYWKNFLKKMKLDNWILDFLSDIKKRNIRIWIVTDLTAYIQLQKMEVLGISDYIDVLVTSEEAGIEKPHPSIFLLATHKLGVLAKDCIMVWDNIIKDIEWSQSLGMKGVWVNRDASHSRWITPRYIVKDSSEMIDVLYWLLKS
jgi:putative hydrolase of the HAD superfamily